MKSPDPFEILNGVKGIGTMQSKASHDIDLVLVPDGDLYTEVDVEDTELVQPFRKENPRSRNTA